MLAVLKTLPARLAMSMGVIVFTAVIVSDRFSFSHEYWLVLAAFLVGQASKNAPVRQALIVFLLLVAGIILPTLLSLYANRAVLDSIVGLVFIASAQILFLNRAQLSKIKLLIMLFSFILLFAIATPVLTQYMMKQRLIDVVIGSLLGLIIGKIIFPVNFAKQFRQGMVPILHALQHFSHALAQAFTQAPDCQTDYHVNSNPTFDCHASGSWHPEKAQKDWMPASAGMTIQSQRIQVEDALLSQQGMYPEWVYELGFNPGLRAGSRFFLVNIERITEVLFSMDYLRTCKVDTVLLQDIAGRIKEAAEKNNELFTMLLEYFTNNTLLETTANFTTDMAELESALRRVLPGDLELIDISPDYLIMTAFVRDIKDLRELLLQLVMALPRNITP